MDSVSQCDTDCITLQLCDKCYCVTYGIQFVAVFVSIFKAFAGSFLLAMQ